MSQGFTRGIPIDIDGALSANSNSLIPSQKAVKTYVDTKVATKQDTLVSGTNIKTINGATILGGGDISLATTYPTTYQIINSTTLAEQLIPNLVTNSLLTFGITANRCYLNPFCLGMDYTVTKLAVEVTTLGASSTFYLGIYELDPITFEPTGAPIAVTSGLSGTTTGLKTGTLSSPVALTKGTLYGISILSNVAITIRAITALNWYGGNIGAPSLRASINQLRTAGFTTLPSDLVPDTLVNAVVQPAIALYRN